MILEKAPNPMQGLELRIFSSAVTGGGGSQHAAKLAGVRRPLRRLDALRLMEDRVSQISVLPVVDPATQQCLGLLRAHDIYRADLE
jgi:hypothetical protein